MTKIEDTPKVVHVKPTEVTPLAIKSEKPNYIALLGEMFSEMAKSNGEQAAQKSRESSLADLESRAKHGDQSKRHSKSGNWTFGGRVTAPVVQVLALAYTSRTGMNAEQTKRYMQGAEYAGSALTSVGSWFAKGHEGQIDGTGRSETAHAQSVEQTTKSSQTRTEERAYALAQFANSVLSTAGSAYRPG
ncbi:MAG: hypothetical protein P0S95_01225 [Rhabdochlamydiaceae bacterium]|nr:hypothetical protein [Candidatus Amphrikana amoebophyrae]